MLKEKELDTDSVVKHYLTTAKDGKIQCRFSLVHITESDPIKAFSDPIKERLYQAVSQDGTLNYAEYAAIVGASEATVKRRLGDLKKEGAIIRVGSNKTGHWEVNKKNM